MRALIVYDTSYGNTKIIAETISETLRDSGMEADLLHVSEVGRSIARGYDLLAVGCPTRMGTMSFAIRGFLGKVKSDEWLDKPFVAFDTENPENIDNPKNKGYSAAEKIAERLREKKLTELSPVLKARVLGMKGPLVEGEVQRTKDYATELAVKLRQLTATAVS